MKKCFVIGVLLCAVVTVGQAQHAARGLAQRILGDKASAFEFVLTKDSGDVFTLSQNGGKIRIEGSNDNAMCMGLNYYLKEYAHVHVSWYASQPVELPRRMPKMTEPVTHRCKMPVRFFLNYCTYGYTMVWWQWKEWERFIDWMALNGVNMPLALTGQEAVWQEVWRELGMTDDEIRSYFSGPAHLPWHRMANLDGFGGPLPQRWIDGQRNLQKKILARERALGMTPVLPAFAGHVPKQIAERYPQADIKQLSSWCGFEPTCFMNSTDSLFAVIQRLYLAKQTALYGTDHIYGVDPFNEMDPPSWEPEYLASVSENIYASLQQVDSVARWLQMSWVFYYKRKQWTPERLRAYLTAVPQGRMVLLDYFCEKTEVWRETEGFFGQPFIWCYLGNFGGNTMLVGDLNVLRNKLDAAYSEQGGNMVGVGSTLESFDNSPQIFELLLEHPWGLDDSAQRVSAFTRRWADLRYGKEDEGCREAWRLLVDSVYKDWSFYGLGTQMVARPSLSGHGTYYTKPYYSYDNGTLLRAVRLMMQSPSKRSAYQYDVANLLSQWLGNHFMEVRDAYTAAYRRGDTALMHRYAALALELIDDADTLLRTVKPFDFYEWAKQAHAWGRGEREQIYYETQARTLLTVWGGPVLNDYANRMWAWLLKDYYRTRWSLFFDAVDSTLAAGNRFDEKAFGEKLSEFEHKWTQGARWVIAEGRQDGTVKVAKYIMRKIDKGQYDVPNRVADVMGAYMQRFPEAQLRDVYKSCFQDVYGPGHIIKDSVQCAQYVEQELQYSDTGDHRFPDYEYTGVEGNYVRVNLRVLKAGKVEVGHLVRLMMESARQAKKMPLYDWRGQWERIKVALRGLDQSIRPHRFEEDEAAIEGMLNSGEVDCHHSQRFKDAYAPHYRIVRRDLFEREILPLLFR